ncbi:MAG: Dolichyl-phosphate beta-glucosyltransferase [Candidatus Daviesbacteria bacterium GW2011_GWA1_41_61]|uniref:Dolichyl-phosphate beta-glucosyltransferase n=1 Tax=Candidatus Daviesbacteria bacterium GW2011_GWA2_40_9 TaxID=1618424 RepID=A0A0G0U5V8_9BACT|nr:MAG: Dolichyl-phosphate beta-glucosyltransferase [Candidatus Daviesbacteria bacterium GW2011_GWC1_40_9]KKR82576.1 MAG: Dolichyl-phosphate beta-glucosyltransferase [Candidatus Daviesbacteria bacterium GW2011_GWA2_40_9]KKR93027.1 MAG: Dolichyl-phosphate beta-glucosyltransferase [Candidatus Daviesbacteria bacterium GW2011_GWB1_41_15]KKS15571.1 MAG: Dolichyl-phosphate beta-glucosyltransferase [Candidatus Daviesbacteria bacterium GW2011_GWA1_41_61]
MGNLKLSVVIPAYNEEKNLSSGVLDKVSSYLEKQAYPYEVLIVDDGSTDKTADVIEQFIKSKKGFKLIRNPHGGKALTVISGMLKASGEIIVFTDLDQSTPINQIEKFFPKFEEGFDVVIGSRKGREGAPLIRKLSAWGFAVIRNLSLGLPFADTQCGFKAFNQKAIREVFPKMLQIWQGMKAKGAAVNAGFDIEMLFLARKMGFKIAEVPITWHHVGTERVQLIHDALEALKDMGRIRKDDLDGKYG